MKVTGLMSWYSFCSVCIPSRALVSAYRRCNWHNLAKPVNRALNIVTDKLAEYGLWSKADNTSKVPAKAQEVDLESAEDDDYNLRVASTAGSCVGAFITVMAVTASAPVVIAAAAIGATAGEGLLHAYRHRQAAAEKIIPPITSVPAANAGEFKQVAPAGFAPASLEFSFYGAQLMQMDFPELPDFRPFNFNFLIHLCLAKLYAIMTLLVAVRLITKRIL